MRSWRSSGAAVEWLISCPWLLDFPNDVAEIMDFRRRAKIGKSWPVIIEKLRRQVAVASGAKTNA
jgi:hypothetical protein